MGLREKYKIVEFRQARQALDGYYGALNTLAVFYKGNASKERKAEQAKVISEARERLRRATEGLGFTVVVAEQKDIADD